MMIKKIAACAVSAALLFGCNGKEYFEKEFRGAFDTNVYFLDLPREIQTVPIDFENPKAGDNATILENALDFSLRAGIGGSYGDEFRFRSGVDGKFSIFSLLDGYYRSSNYDIRREPIRGESYTFAQFNPDAIGAEPYFGVEYRPLNKNFSLGVEVAFPYQGFQYRTGRDTFGEWQTFRKDKWHGFGLGGRIFLNMKPKAIEPFDFFVSLGYERFEPELFGKKVDVNAVVGALGIRRGF